MPPFSRSSPPKRNRAAKQRDARRDKRADVSGVDQAQLSFAEFEVRDATPPPVPEYVAPGDHAGLNLLAQSLGMRREEGEPWFRWDQRVRLQSLLVKNTSRRKPDGKGSANDAS